MLSVHLLEESMYCKILKRIYYFCIPYFTVSSVFPLSSHIIDIESGLWRFLLSI